MPDNLIYNHSNLLEIGRFSRYILTYRLSKSETNNNDDGQQLRIQVKNVELPMKKLLYLLGPYSLYVQLLPWNFNESLEHNPDPSDQNLVQISANIHPSKSFHGVLELNENSLVNDAESQEFNVYRWRLDVMSQAILSDSVVTHFDVSITSHADGNHDASSSITSLSTGVSTPESRIMDPLLDVEVQSSADIWNKPPPNPSVPAHLVILTHGVYSNIDCDLLYIKEKLELNSKGENIMIRGYHGNVGHTERGIKWLGINLANYIDYLLNNGDYKIDRISFLGHSLGGVVQSFAIYYLLNYEGYKTGIINYARDDIPGSLPKPNRVLLKSIRPVNFMTLAAPLLGTQAEFDNLINLGLEVGSLGKTGKDLSLRNRYFSKFNLKVEDAQQNKLHVLLKPLLETISIDLKFHFYLKAFEHRVVFANVLNDGIVPLKTSALMYLDYQSLRVAELLKKAAKDRQKLNGQSEIDSEVILNGKDPAKTSSFWRGKWNHRNKNGSAVGEIPEDLDNSDSVFNIEDETKISEGMKKTFNNTETGSSEPATTSARTPLPLKSGSKKVEKRNSSSTLLRSVTALSKLQVKKEDKMHKFQTLDSKGTLKSFQSDDTKDTRSTKTYRPPKSSSVLSAINVLKAPAPQKEFFMNFKPLEQKEVKAMIEDLSKDLNATESPQTEPDETVNLTPEVLDSGIIIHDRTYSFDELPPPHYNKISAPRRLRLRADTRSKKPAGNTHRLTGSYIISDVLQTNGKDIPFFYHSRKTNAIVRKHFKSSQLAEKLARCYHFDKSWRKVLVCLKPDAHNNIVVRRQFVNSYGWNVIHYLASIFEYGAKHGEKTEKYLDAVSNIEKLENVHYDASISLLPIAGSLKRLKLTDTASERLNEEEMSDRGLSDVEEG
ncbi:hypothetical protein DASC09_043740 [Saccharomycopsis crataegensis]|uniref:DUF676 domain-containing protein n=1 Tax=Saccharomycopsis crataegensis TaxID=43959 RepID=A0AAV5QRI1_9ASCO|nr:hypothetical protein DASC09_043740 [Saccharomycopsis crataegensis]